MKRMTHLVLVAAGLLGVAPAPARAETLYTLKMKFKVGEQRRYSMVSKNELDFPGLPPHLAGGVRIQTELGVKVLSVEANGDAKAALSLGPIDIQPPMPNQGPAALIPDGCTLVISPNAKAKLVPGTCGGNRSILPLVERVLSTFGFLPDKPTAVGGQWRMPIDLDAPPMMPGGPPAKLRGDALLTLRAIEKRGPRTCAVVVMDGTVKIEAEMGQGMGHMKSTIKGESCFDMDQGDWADGKATMDMQVGFEMAGSRMEGKTRSFMELTRLADGPITKPVDGVPADGPPKTAPAETPKLAPPAPPPSPPPAESAP
jgi:hypothetical protein